MKPYRLLFWTFALPCFVSCSVKADRAGCPCSVNVSVDGGCEGLVELCIQGGGHDMTEQIRCPGNGQKHEFRLPRNTYSLCAYSGVKQCVIESSCTLMIPHGCQMDELFAWTGEVCALSESVDVRATQLKQFAYVYLSIEYETGAFEDGILRFESNVTGFDIRRMESVQGKFVTECYPVFENNYRVCLPRQIDDAATVTFVDGGRVLPLGKYIAASGFDWTKANLDDVYVTINEITAEISIRIVKWENGFVKQVII